MDPITQYFLNAVILDQVKEVTFLLEEKPSLVFVRDQSGNTALHLAPSVAMVNALTCSGADPRNVNKSGIYPDEAAISRKQEAVANAIRRSWPESARG